MHHQVYPLVATNPPAGVPPSAPARRPLRRRLGDPGLVARGPRSVPGSSESRGGGVEGGWRAVRPQLGEGWVAVARVQARGAGDGGAGVCRRGGAGERVRLLADQEKKKCSSPRGWWRTGPTSEEVMTPNILRGGIRLVQPTDVTSVSSAAYPTSDVAPPTPFRPPSDPLPTPF
eukprot:890453-Prorocentrum_minimum.AAC.1